jgi:hypothetical protein
MLSELMRQMIKQLVYQMKEGTSKEVSHLHFHDAQLCELLKHQVVEHRVGALCPQMVLPRLVVDVVGIRQICRNICDLRSQLMLVSFDCKRLTTFGTITSQEVWQSRDETHMASETHCI